MNKFLLIATIIFALAGCYLAQIGNPPGWKTDSNMKPVVDAVCNASKRPDQTQWTNLLNCTNLSNTTSLNKTADPKQDKYAEMVKGVYANCSKVADDVPAALKTTNEDQMKVINMFCSQKFEDCQQNAMKQVMDQMKNDRPNPDDLKKQNDNKIVTITK